ncbi:uncharacterized protein SPPG_01773 [Spizellomyces punctatus DAOM BR117]|uniref:DDT domain-containing protein n=1 Tax=Spizellomyces punctatus (strain DAOM BR117) TaxID=645134 RepID=A0A0L0HNN5_SPIPD|nr:uncharacterized protein SPPG_01773 [Spizellomyces punctatus DAOM BR117]KND02687.1 hypothetical protein SPPG_01773 [Spizellomyces punctatus DAOM BR117]|eukprot:XP_016610726.1 hypothetical protein SPPG_01773 [Spizellomyces punctatus DAOM BR117]
MPDGEGALQELRQYWEFAAVCQFLHLFHHALRLSEFSSDELEIHLTTCPVEEKLIDLHVRLLKSLVGPLAARQISTENWQTYLQKEFAKTHAHSDIFAQGVDYVDLPLRSKVLVLHSLCERQFDNAERFRASLNTEEETEWRVEHVGSDAKGNVYWLFDDNRLYKEAPAPTIGKSRNQKKGKLKSGNKNDLPWELICSSMEEWQSFPERFKKSRSAVEKEFYLFLIEDALPKVLADLENKEKQRRVQEAMNNRKRSSRLQVRELEKMEQERQEQLIREQREQERSRRSQLDRKQREELERQRRIEAREQRIMEREARLHGLREDKGHVINPSDEDACAREQTTSQPATRRKRKRHDEFEERWYFDCVCGVHGDNLDDGTPMIACGKCGVWQHIGCLAQAPGAKADDVDIQKWEALDYVCNRCARHGNQERARVVSHNAGISSRGSDIHEVGPQAGRGNPIGSIGNGVASSVGHNRAKTSAMAGHPNWISNYVHSPKGVVARTAAGPGPDEAPSSVTPFVNTALHPSLESMALPHPASPAYYQPYSATAVLPSGVAPPAHKAITASVATSGTDTASAAAFLASLAAGYKPRPGPAAVESFPAPVSLVPAQQPGPPLSSNLIGSTECATPFLRPGGVSSDSEMKQNGLPVSTTEQGKPL